MSPEIATSLNTDVPFSLSRIIMSGLVFGIVLSFIIIIVIIVVIIKRKIYCCEGFQTVPACPFGKGRREAKINIAKIRT